MLLLFVLAFSFSGAYTQWSIDLETGLPFEGYNDVRIPNETGTKFSFTDDFELQGPVIPIRLMLRYSFDEKNHLFALFAPLGVTYEGPAPFDISFQRSLFTQGQLIEGFYKFNSYRLGYRRDVLTSDGWTIGVGFTAKIRDARVQLSSGGLSDRKDDLGFVPLLHLFASREFDRWMLYLEGDGLAGGPGRAFDFFLGGSFNITDNLSGKAGYRILEGGADVTSVYNFTLINFAVIGLVWDIL
ncbi:MAG: hypothetical protein EA408_00880 [Marinilabiliales bacterium]|nr:MAG: hypothetical protein EA408_00880 [Marinilabiliales bacterium]